MTKKSWPKLISITGGSNNNIFDNGGGSNVGGGGSSINNGGVFDSGNFDNGGFDNTNLDPDINCDRLGTCYDGNHFLFFSSCPSF